MDDATDPSLTYRSSNTKVAKVNVKANKITIKAVGKGKAKITVCCGSKKQTVTVTVK